MDLNPGKINAYAYAGSMAEAIEDAFVEVWKSEKNSAPPPIMLETKLLFIAIAQGVVKHLKDNPDAFSITFNTGNHTYTCNISIKAKNII